MEKEKVIQELMELDRLYYEKLKKEGPSAWISPYAKDAIVVTENNGPNIIGIENIKKFADTYIVKDGYEVFFEALSADVSDDFTLGYTTGYFTMKNIVNGKPIDSMGKYLLVWKKYDGEWKASLIIDNGKPIT